LAIVYGTRRLRELHGLARVLLGAFLAALAAYLAQAAVSIDTLPIPLMEWASIGAIAAFADPGRGLERSAPASATRGSRAVAGLLGVAMFPLAALITNPLVADHTAKVGQRIGDAGGYALSSRHFERAMTLDAREGTYPYLAGIAQENQASASSSRADQGVFLRRAIALYARALRRAPGQPFFQRSFARATTALAVNVEPSRFPAADRAWRACVDDDPNDWEVRASHADMLAAWATAGGGDQARAQAIQELKRIVSMRGLEKRAVGEVARISTKLGLRRSPPA
jgi:hypothetical protein